MAAAGVLADAAHFVSPVDVRPARAAGAVRVLSAPGLLRGGAAGELSAVVLPDDLGER
ncbi:hypothetical protein [Streptomyces sp. NPDC000983]|uniref:hypothetical protein n=1 Tax=Streptomyces sp. NPDC000983 TaxID=3154373 RepID=UPI00332DFF6F